MARKSKGKRRVTRRYSARDYAEVAAYRQPFKSRAVRRSLAARLLGRDVHRLKDLSPRLAVARTVVPRRARRALVAVNVVHGPKRYVRQGALVIASPKYRRRIEEARRLRKECEEGKKARRHQLFKHLHRGGKGGGHSPRLRVHARC